MGKIEEVFAKVSYSIVRFMYIIYFSAIILVCLVLTIQHFGTISSLFTSFVGVMCLVASIKLYKYYDRHLIWLHKELYKVDLSAEKTSKESEDKK